MKKLIALFMCLTLCLSMFAACGNKEDDVAEQGNDLAFAGDYLFSLYLEKNFEG